MNTTQIYQTKTTVMRHLNAAKREMSVKQAQGLAPFAVGLRLRIAHLQTALDNWINGISEYKFIL